MKPLLHLHEAIPFETSQVPLLEQDIWLQFVGIVVVGTALAVARSFQKLNIQK